ncbi:hypothetical protein CS542_10650 [Pedobacter sp. IW39]|nr:hypothetical protein CS542_10650 [Pedobacter sp. IW39]
MPVLRTKQLNDPTYHFVKISSASKSKQLQNWLLLYLLYSPLIILINAHGKRTVDILCIRSHTGRLYDYYIRQPGLFHFSFRELCFKPAIRLLNFPKISLKTLIGHGRYMPC